MMTYVLHCSSDVPKITPCLVFGVGEYVEFVRVSSGLLSVCQQGELISRTVLVSTRGCLYVCVWFVTCPSRAGVARD